MRLSAHVLTTAKGDQRATRCPGHDRLVSEYFRLPSLHGAGESNPGSDFMAAGTSLGMDLFMGVFG